jgi:hypothetical protein
MKYFSIRALSDGLFVALCTFFLLFTLLEYFKVNAVISCICAGLFSLIALFFAYIYSQKKYNTKRCKANFFGKVESCMLELMTMPPVELKGIFDKLNAKENFADGDNFYFFKYSAITADDVLYAKRSGTKACTTIFCNKADDDAVLFAKRFNFTLYQAEDVYNLLKDNDLLPGGNSSQTKHLQKPKIFSIKMSKAKCLPLFLSGATLLAMSYFTMFPAYYVASGALLTILSCIFLLFGKRQNGN